MTDSGANNYLGTDSLPGCCSYESKGEGNGKCRYYAGQVRESTSQSKFSAFEMQEECYSGPSTRALRRALLSASPSPPIATLCVEPAAPNVRLPPTQRGSWFNASAVLYERWAAALTAREACQDWCQEEIDSDCSLRMSVLSGHLVSCGFKTETGTTLGRCAVVTGLILSVEPRPTIGSGPTYYAPTTGSPNCYVNPYEITPCDRSPGTACEASGADIALGQTLCGQLDPACRETSYDDCLTDYCLLGGDPSVVEITDSDCGEDDSQTGRVSPPPVAPPSPPRWGAQHCLTDPLTGKHACVVLPFGYDINSNDPTVKRAITLAFRLEPMGNTQYIPP